MKTNRFFLLFPILLPVLWLQSAERELGICPCMSGPFLEWEALTPETPQEAGPYKARALAVDPDEGTLYALTTSTLWKSADQGNHWTVLADEKNISGKLWYGLALVFDPHTGGLGIFLKDPPAQRVQSAVSLDEGNTWNPVDRVIMDGDKGRSYGWSWGQVDWANDPTRMLARMHHSTRLWFSEDAGSNWKEIAESPYFGFAPDGAILVADPSIGNIRRSTDQGETWEVVAENLAVHAFRPVIHGDHIYWLGEGGLFRGNASGSDWEPVGSALRYAYWGPYYGETEDDIIVATKDGVFHTADAGYLWTKIADNPIMTAEAHREKPTQHFWLIGRNTFGWDVKNQILFLADGKLHKLDLSPLLN